MSDKKTQTPPSKLRITINEDETHRIIWRKTVSRRKLTVAAVAALLLLGVIFWFTVAYTPLRSLIPGYPDARSRKAAIENALRVDSLERAIARWYLYTEDLRRVLEGEPSLGIDSIGRLAARPVSPRAASQDSLLRAEVTAQEQFALSSRTSKTGIDGQHFFTPVKGVLSFSFDRITHPYVDITVPGDTPVKATLDGTVISSNFSEFDGYSIILQHANNIISAYRHCDRLLCKVGEKVSAGSAIAFLGKANDHLHFELWYDGEPVDPAIYLHF